MGASDNYYTLKGSDKAELTEHHAQRVNEFRNERGTGGYSGSWAESTGLKVYPKTFDTRDLAYDYLEDAIRKWEPDIAVQFKDDAGVMHWMVGGCHSS